MAIQKGTQQMVDKFYQDNGLVNNSGQASLLDYYSDKANQKLQGDTAYLNNMLKAKESSAAILNNTDNLKQAIDNSTGQLVNAQYQSNQKIAKSNLGNSGLSMLNAVDASQANKSIQQQLDSTTKTNRQTLDTMNLYDEANARAIFNNVFDLMNQDIKQNDDNHGLDNALSTTGASKDDAYNVITGLSDNLHPANDPYDPAKDNKTWDDKLKGQ